MLRLSAVGIAAFLISSIVSVQAHQAAGVAGVWKLNVAESNNPNGPDPAASRPATPPRGGGGQDMTGGAASQGAGAQAISQLSPEEKSRINRMLTLLNKAATTLEIVVDGNDVTIKQDGTGFPKQNADGKKFELRNPQIGEVDIKIKIDNKGMTREVHTQDDLKVVENYTLSADGKQLTVTVKPSQPVMKIPDGKIKRVYYRQ
jgi:hypothetical protein